MGEKNLNANNFGKIFYFSRGKSENRFAPQHIKTNNMTCAASEDLDQPGHPPSLIRFFAVRI